MSDLFQSAARDLARQKAPLADRVRPRSFAGFCGQEALTGPDAPLRQAIENDAIPSMILWGPPGSGKTTLARVVAAEAKSHFVSFSAVTSGVKEARALIQHAKERLHQAGRRTILFVDEIHRFNKAQQDAFLPHVESGTIILIGATTENPSFEINAALRSRCRVFVLEPLGVDALVQVLERALRVDEQLAAAGHAVEPGALQALAEAAFGDARNALSNLEWVLACRQREREKDPRTETLVDQSFVRRVLPQKTLLYDKSGEEHFNLISALHKSIRDSDPQGALYWFARMVESGEEPMFLARRLVRIASEDVGLADPGALTFAVTAKEAFHLLGTPEGELALAELVLYLATAPKSNCAYVAFGEARKAAKEHGPLPVPLHLRNATTKLAKELGYGKGYQYAHDHEDAAVEQQHLPDPLKNTEFYQPGKFGFEREIKKRLQWWAKVQRKPQQRDPKDSG